MKPLSYYIEKFLNSNKSSKIEDIAPMPECSPIVTEEADNIVPDEKFEKLAEQVASLVKHYDAMSEKISDDNMKALLSDMSSHLINSLVLGGCQPISDDTEYDMVKHVTRPASLTNNGTPIKNILRIGVYLGEKVIIPAIVEI